MSFWDSIADMFINEVAGSYLIVSVLILSAIFFSLFFMRVPKEVFIALTSLYLVYMVNEGILKGWIFFLAIILMGVSIASGLLKIFYSR